MPEFTSYPPNPVMVDTRQGRGTSNSFYSNLFSWKPRPRRRDGALHHSPQERKDGGWQHDA